MILDWLPFYLILLAYDFLRGFVGNNPIFDPHFLPQIQIDEFLFGGTVPTVTPPGSASSTSANSPGTTCSRGPCT